MAAFFEAIVCSSKIFVNFSKRYKSNDRAIS